MLLVAMERTRRASAVSGSGVVFASLRQRGKNLSDEEDKMPQLHESRSGKRPKKESLGLSTSRLSGSPVSKRGRWGMARDIQLFGCHAEGQGFVVGAKTEGNEEPAPPQYSRKRAKSRVQSNEVNFFMNISAVPRKPRTAISLSSRMTSAKNYQDLCASQQQSPIANANGSCLPHSGSLSQKPRKRLKHSGVEPHYMKIAQTSVISDQEAEVAEVLFVLAQSSQLCAGFLESKLEAKLAIEGKSVPLSATQSFTIAPSNQEPVFASAGHTGKLPRGIIEKVERRSHIDGEILLVNSPSELVHSSVGETELESSLQREHSVAGEEHSFPSRTESSKILAGSSHSVPRWPCHAEQMTTKCLEEQRNNNNGAIKVEQGTQINGDAEEGEPGVCRVKGTASQENTVDSLENCDEAPNNPHPSNRSYDCDGDISKSKIDLETSAFSDKKEFSLENLSGGALVKEYSLDCLNLKDQFSGAKQIINQVSAEGHKRGATCETDRKLLDGDMKEEDTSSKLSPNINNNDTGTSSVSSCFSSLSSTPMSRHATVGLAGWMNGFSQLGSRYHWGPTSSLFGTSGWSLNMQSIHPALQLPHAAVSASVPKMKSCATHVYLAHYIQHEQQVARHSLWSAAFSRASTAHNLNVPPVKYLDTGRPGEAFTQKAQSRQSNMHQTANNGSIHGSGVVGSVSSSNLPSSSQTSSETSTVTASGHAMAAHAQYLQIMMQQNRAASMSFPASGSSGQIAPVFNGPYYRPHLIPHLQPLAQQAGNVPPVFKQQLAKGAASSAPGAAAGPNRSSVAFQTSTAASESC